MSTPNPISISKGCNLWKVRCNLCGSVVKKLTDQILLKFLKHSFKTSEEKRFSISKKNCDTDKLIEQRNDELHKAEDLYGSSLCNL